jgi:hypothetical protein
MTAARDSIHSSFRGASAAREPGIQKHLLAYLDSGPALRKSALADLHFILAKSGKPDFARVPE